MSYAVKELYLTVQGEGGQAGRAAVFCRFAGCNLWSGREVDRAEAVCRFCDTDFVGINGPGGGRYQAGALVAAAQARWTGPEGQPKLVVFTGGEPTLQLDGALVAAFRSSGWETAVETNGTLPAPEELDWICVSPKAGTTLAQTAGQELKLVFPQEGWTRAHSRISSFSGSTCSRWTGRRRRRTPGRRSAIAWSGPCGG